MRAEQSQKLSWQKWRLSKSIRYRLYKFRTGYYRRALTQWCYPIAKLSVRWLEHSPDFFVLNLREVKPDLFELRERPYSEYRSLQIEGNQMKLLTNYESGSEWERKLFAVTEDLILRFQSQTLIRGLCMGARNGAEVRELKSRLLERKDVQIWGTDISPTALRFPEMFVHDFHDPIPLDKRSLDFVYSNSLDQSQNPKVALEHWVDALQPEGCIYLHMSRSHGKQGVSNLDPFGCEPELFPYVLLTWLRGSAHVETFFELNSDQPCDVVFVIRRNASS